MPNSAGAFSKQIYQIYRHVKLEMTKRRGENEKVKVKLDGRKKDLKSKENAFLIFSPSHYRVSHCQPCTDVYFSFLARFHFLCCIQSWQHAAGSRHINQHTHTHTEIFQSISFTRRENFAAQYLTNKSSVLSKMRLSNFFSLFNLL